MAASPDQVPIVGVGDNVTSEACLLDICDRQAKLAASLNRRKPSARDQQDAESQAHDATLVCRAAATPWGGHPGEPRDGTQAVMTR